MREGVCSECQQVHRVRSKGFSPEEDDDDDGLIDGEVRNWAMATHDAFGSHCDGSGTMPQALVGEKKPVSLDDLNRDVTVAIVMAEQFEDTGNDGCTEAYRKVSALEEQIAEHPDVQTIEREVSRRGAINAAEKAGDVDRASTLRTRWDM
jgi:hypothetical protein